MRLGVNGERYYRSMFGGRVSSWSLHDTHMVVPACGGNPAHSCESCVTQR